MKRFASISLAIIMLFALIPFSASANDDFVFSLSTDSTYYIVFQYNGDEKEVVIPAEYDGKPVKKIGDSAFMSCLDLTSVVISEGIESIGEYAFSQCKNIVSITFPKTLKDIGESAFWGCNGLESIVIENNVETMGSNVFKNCKNLANIYCEAKSIPDGWEDDWNDRCDAKVNWNSNEIRITKNLSSVVCNDGDIAKVEVGVEGVGLTYKWYYKNSNSNDFALTNTYKGNCYSVQMDETRAGRQVYCVITNAFGKSVQTNVATLGMKFEIISETKEAIVQSGKIASVTLKVSGEGVTYNWYYKNKGEKEFTLTNTFKGETYYVEMNSVRASRQIYCVVTDKYGNSMKSSVITLGMAVKIKTQPKSVGVENGKVAKVTVSASGEGLTYKWYFKNKGESKFSYTSTFKGNTYSVTMNSTRASRQVYCVITDKYGNTVKTSTVTLGMAVKITTQPKSVTVANGKEARVSVAASGEGLTYKWYYKNKGDSKFTLTKTFTGKSYYVTMTNARAGRQVYCIVTDKYGNSKKTNTVTLNKK